MTYQDVLNVIPNVNQSLFNQGPLYNRALHQGDVQTCNSYNKGKDCYRNPCLFAHVCNRCYGGHPGIHCRAQLPECNKCGNVHSGSRCPTSQAQWNKPPPPRETTQGNNNQPLNDKDDLYVYMGDVCNKHTLQVYSTPVNVGQLEQALSSHPDKQSVEKLCRVLREGARIGYTGPCMPKKSRTYPVRTKILRLFRLILWKR